MKTINKTNDSDLNQILAYYYVSWTLAMPDQVEHLGLDFTKEYSMAKIIYKS